MPGHKPSFVSTSLWQTPQACTLMRTCPASGVGISRLTICKSAPGLGTSASFIGAVATFVLAINPPRNFQPLFKPNSICIGARRPLTVRRPEVRELVQQITVRPNLVSCHLPIREYREENVDNIIEVPL